MIRWNAGQTEKPVEYLIIDLPGKIEKGKPLEQAMVLEFFNALGQTVGGSWRS